MVSIDDIVITGLGCISPIGLGVHAFWQGLSSGKCGTRQIFCSHSGDRILYGAPISEFDAKQYVTPRKALKLMSREVQLAYAAAHLAWEDAALATQALDPDRIGVIFGSEIISGDIDDVIPAVRACISDGKFDPSRWGTEFSKSIFPLWMLRNLPNMPASHVSLAIDARGPSNTIAQEEISGLLALGEAINIMQRGDADLVLVGAMGSRVTPTRLAYRMPGHYMDIMNCPDGQPACENASSEGDKVDVRNDCYSPAFDAFRKGIVPSEGSVVFVLEKRRHAVARSARIYGTVLSTACRYGRPSAPHCGSSAAIASAAVAATHSAGLSISDLACVSAQGYSQKQLDRVEAAAISQLSDVVPVTAYSSYFGIAGSASGLMQLAAGLLATSAGKILPIIGYSTPDPECPVAACQHEQPISKPYLLQLSFTVQGQSAAVVLDCNEESLATR